MRRPPGHRAAVVLAFTGVLVVGCGDDPDPGTQTTGSAAVSWPTSTDPVQTTGLVYAVGSTVHRADGSTLEVEKPIETFVLAGDGVFFTSSADEPTGDYAAGRPLYFSPGDGTSEELTDGASSLRSSPDGRYLAYLDSGSGEEDDYGTPQAVAVAVDLVSGEEVVRSSEGMGDPDTDDLAHEYPESNLGILELTDRTAYVGTLGEVIAYDLGTGEGGTSDRSSDDLEPPSPYDDLPSPDGEWRIRNGSEIQDELVSTAGDEVTPEVGTPLLDLQWWVDPRTAAGFAIDGRLRGGQLSPGATSVLVTCVVPSGACSEAPDTLDAEVVLPEGTA